MFSNRLFFNPSLSLVIKIHLCSSFAYAIRHQVTPVMTEFIMQQRGSFFFFTPPLFLSSATKGFFQGPRGGWQPPTSVGGHGGQQPRSRPGSFLVFRTLLNDGTGSQLLQRRARVRIASSLLFISGRRRTDAPPTRTRPSLRRSSAVLRNVPAAESPSTLRRRSWGRER